MRDLLLQRKSKDIDVVVVGYGVKFASAVAKKLGKCTNISIFKTYGTAQVKTPLSFGHLPLEKGEIVEVEFAGARKESYQQNSRNPIVEVGTLKNDSTCACNECNFMRLNTLKKCIIASKTKRLK